MNLNNKNMADSRFAISSKDGIQNLKKKLVTTTQKSTQIWINVWHSWVEERGINPNLEENSAKVLDSILLNNFMLRLETKEASPTNQKV